MPEVAVANAISSIEAAATTRAPVPERVIRPSHVTENQISFLWQPGVVIAELVYEPGHEPGQGLSFIIRDEEGVRRSSTVSPLPYRPLRWIEDYARCNAIRLPTAAEPHGSLDSLAEQIRG